MDVQQLGARSLRHGEALESAPSWLWGIVGSCWALGSEALEVGVSGDTLED